MQPDPIVEEVHAAREAYARRFNDDLKEICRDLRERQRTSGRRVISAPPRESSTDLEAERKEASPA